MELVLGTFTYRKYRSDADNYFGAFGMSEINQFNFSGNEGMLI
jgi:hypothetical protein